MVEKNKVFQIGVHCIMVLLMLFCLIPFLLLVVSSFTAESALFCPVTDQLRCLPSAACGFQQHPAGIFPVLCRDCDRDTEQYCANALVCLSAVQKRLAGKRILLFYGIFYDAVQWRSCPHLHDVDWCIQY